MLDYLKGRSESRAISENYFVMTPFKSGNYKSVNQYLLVIKLHTEYWKRVQKGKC